MSEYRPVLPFESDDPEFVRGFECGRIWALLAQHEQPLKVLAHKSNAEMLLRMAESTGRPVQTEEMDDEEHEYDHLEATFAARAVEA